MSRRWRALRPEVQDRHFGGGSVAGDVGRRSAFAHELLQKCIHRNTQLAGPVNEADFGFVRDFDAHGRSCFQVTVSADFTVPLRLVGLGALLEAGAGKIRVIGLRHEPKVEIPEEIRPCGRARLAPTASLPGRGSFPPPSPIKQFTSE